MIVTNNIHYATSITSQETWRLISFGTSDVIRKTTKLRQTVLISDKDTDKIRGTYMWPRFTIQIIHLDHRHTISSCTCGLVQHRI
jgi:hypothetical protein